MSTRAIYSYIYTLIISVIAVVSSTIAYAQEDSTSSDTVTVKKEKKIESINSQLCIGIDIFAPIMNQLVENKYGYELAADYYLRKEFYGVLEGGWGGVTVDYPDLKYTTSNQFARIGFNRNALSRHTANDWDIMFVGFRAGVARIHRDAASYVVLDSLWGNDPGVAPAKNFAAVWAEITAGMRIELYKGLFAGWNIRARFLMNGRSFKDLAPLYIAGYGKGDANSTFDFNLYLAYGIRWRRETTPVVK
jgi:hypothetical protein